MATRADRDDARGLFFVLVQLRVLLALLMREMATRYGKSWGGYVWAVLEPAGFVTLLSLVFAQISAAPPVGRSFPLFYATGYMAFHVYMDISSAVSLSVAMNRPLLNFPRVTLLDVVLARFALQLITSTVAGAVVLGGLLLLIEDQVRLDFGPILAAIGLAALLGLGVGALNCVLFAYSQTWQRLFGVINRPLFIISGIFFVVESMPRQIADALWWNPLVHVTALMRAGFYPIYEPSFVAPLYVIACALAPLMLGVLLLRLLRSDIIEE